MNVTSNISNLVLLTDVEDLRIQSMLDMGFVTEFSTTPNVHAHSCYELLITLEGELSLLLSDGTSLCVEKDQLCIIPPMLYHSTRLDSVKKLAIRFSCERLTTPIDTPSIYDAWYPLLLFPDPIVLSDCDLLCRLLRELRHELTTPHMASNLYMHSLLTQFYILLFRRLSRAQEVPSKQAKQAASEQELRRLRIEEFFFDHFHESIVEDNLAQYMNLSRRQISRILQKTYGMSFRQLLIDTRLHRAEQLLRTTDSSIETIAELVGYNSLSGFYTAFRQKFQISAGQYRKKIRQSQ